MAALKYFEKTRRFDAIVRKFEGKMIKVKQGKESARKRAIIVTADIPITKAMKENLPARVVSFLGQGEKLPGEIAYNKMECDWDMTCVLKVFSRGNHGGKTPDVEKGIDNDDRVNFKLKKFFFIEEVEYMQVRVLMMKDDKTWAWGGRIFGDGEVTMEVKPLQAEMDFDEAETMQPATHGKDDDADEDEEDGKK